MPKEAPTNKAQSTPALFDAMSKLQDVFVAERELRNTFRPIFEDQVNKELTSKLKTLFEK